MVGVRVGHVINGGNGNASTRRNIGARGIRTAYLESGDSHLPPFRISNESAIFDKHSAEGFYVGGP